MQFLPFPLKLSCTVYFIFYRFEWIPSWLGTRIADYFLNGIYFSKYFLSPISLLKHLKKLHKPLGYSQLHIARTLLYVCWLKLFVPLAVLIFHFFVGGRLGWGWGMGSRQRGQITFIQLLDLKQRSCILLSFVSIRSSDRNFSD